MSVIGQEYLKNNQLVVKNKIPVKGCGGNPIPIRGHTLVKLKLDEMELPEHHFWVTPLKFQKFVGIIGTDILASIGAVINCSENALSWDNGSKEPVKTPLNFLHHMEGAADVWNLNKKNSKKIKNLSLQLTPVKDIQIPSGHIVEVEAKFRSPPNLNEDYETQISTIDYAGVIAGRALVRINNEGTVIVPVINLSNQDYLIKGNRFLTLAIPAAPGARQPAEGTLEDMGNNRQCEGGAETTERTEEKGGVALGVTPKAQASQEPPGGASAAPDESAGTPVPMGSTKAEDKSAGQSREHPRAPDLQAEGILPHNTTGDPGINPQPQLVVTHAEKESETTILECTNGNRDDTISIRDDQEESSGTNRERKNSGPCPSNNGEASINTVSSTEKRGRDHQTTDEHNRKEMQEEGTKQPEEAATAPSGDQAAGTLSPELVEALILHQQKSYATQLEQQLPSFKAMLPNRDASVYRGYKRDEERLHKDKSHLADPLKELPEDLKKAVDQAQIPTELASKFHALLLEFKSIFCNEDDPPPSCPLFEQAIHLDTNVPICQKQYPVPGAAKEAINKQVETFLKAGVIKPSNSPYNHAFWPVAKPGGGYRLTLDYRQMNKHLIADPFPIPKIDELLEEFQGVEYFSTLDLHWGFFQVRVRPEDTHKLAFTTSVGRFEFLHLPMGLKIAPAVFQRLMNLVFKDQLNKILLIYLDDIVVYSKDATTHLENLRTAFQRLKQAGLGVKAKKCQIFRTKIKFLGFIVSKEGVCLDPSKIEAVLNFPIPKEDLGQLQSFLGMVGYFKKHIKDYAAIAKPLYDMFKGEDTHTKKRKGKVRTVYKKNVWGQAQDDAVKKLKELTTTAPLLIYPDFSKPLILTTDASQHALGYVLSQVTEAGEKPVAYGSRLLKGAEKNYSNTDREMLAVITGMQHYRSYLYGRHFVVRTDHQAIALINKGKITSQRVCKWVLQTQDYDFEIEYTPATKIRHADALSRVNEDLMSPESLLASEKSPEVNHLGDNGEQDPTDKTPQDPSPEDTIGDVRLDVPDYEPVIDIYEWGKQQQLDPELREKLNWVKEFNPPDYAIDNDTLFQMIKPEDGFVPVAPTVFRKRILAQFHGPPFVGHQGPERTYRNMRKYVYWRGMRKDVEEFIDKCDACQRHKRSYLRIPMQHQMIPSVPFHTVSMDVQGPLVPTEYGEEYILVIQDMLTRWVELAPMKIADTKTILSRLETCWIKRYGYPQRLLTDRASVFTGQEMAEFCNFYGIEKIHTTAYRPQGNGANERTHQELTKYFSMYLENERKEKWRWLLPNAMYVLNTSDHSSLGMSPYEALFAIVPSLGAIGYPRKASEDQEKFEGYYGMRREHVLEIRKRAADLLQKSQDRVVDRHNRYAHDIPFQVGDHVMYKNHRQKTKFDPKYTGPWKIIAQISPTVFELAMGKYRFSAHAVYLKPYHGTVLTEPEEELVEEQQEEVLHPVFDEDDQPVEAPDLRASTPPMEPDPQDELYGPQARSERFMKFKKSFKKKIYRTIPQIRPSAVISSTPTRYQIPSTENEWDAQESLRRGTRIRREPDRYSPS